MSSLFSYLGHRYERNPGQMALYLGEDEGGNGQWQILGMVYTGSVSVLGGQLPVEGNWYPAFCADPDSWRGWVVLILRQEFRQRPEDDLINDWIAFRGNELSNSIELEHVPRSGSGTETWPLFVRAKAARIYLFGGSVGSVEISSAWMLNGEEEPLRWIDFSVNETGLLIQISGYSGAITGDVRFDDEPEAEYPAALPQTLEQRDSEGAVVWQWQPPSISQEYTWDGDESPPGGGGSGGGGF